jgi:hypothetical protein
MEPFPESAVLSWVLGLGITALVIGGMIVGLIAHYWPFSTHSWSGTDRQAQGQSAPGMAKAPRGLTLARSRLGSLETGCLPRPQAILDQSGSSQ